MTINASEIKKAIKPKADSTLNNMKKSELIEYIRCLEYNYNTAVWFNENQARYIEKIGIENVRSQWISVKERLPESQKEVLVSAKTKTFGYRDTMMAAHIGHHEATTEDYGWREYEGNTEYDEENDCFWIPECWWETNSIEDNENWIIDEDYEVTHWMPLPEPPKEDAE